jgi:hypothetical protein
MPSSVSARTCPPITFGASHDESKSRVETARVELRAAAESRVDAVVADLVDEATATTWDLLGELERSVKIRTRQVRMIVDEPGLR